MIPNPQTACDYMLAVTRNARAWGMTLDEFLSLAKIAWDAHDQAEKDRAALTVEGRPES